MHREKKRLPRIVTRLRRLGALVLLAASLPAVALGEGDSDRGATLFALAGGCGCHTAADGAVGAGGGEVPTPFGTFYGTNITPDPETGIGAWSDAEIEEAIRRGFVRGRGVESPAMPYYLYAGMTDVDVSDLIAYLRTLPAVRRVNRPHEGELPLARVAYRIWRGFLAPGLPPAQPSAAALVDRGRYLTDHVAICGDCHTPRNRLGVPRQDAYLAGTRNGPAGEPVPNLTPHESGLAGWDEADIVQLLTHGMLPNFDNVQGLMAELVDGKAGGLGYKDAPASDLRAIAAHLRALPPRGAID